MTETDGSRALAPQRERVVSVVLAAGAARRFGGPKQLAHLHGRPLLEHALDAAATSPSEETLLVLGAHADEIAKRVALAGARVVRCPNWQAGRGASLRAGLAALGPEVAVALVTLGDEPFVSPVASRRLLAARRPALAALRATYSGRPGHPVLVERSLFGPLTSAALETEPAALLNEAGIKPVECGDLGDPVDVDTPEQLAALEMYGGPIRS